MSFPVCEGGKKKYFRVFRKTGTPLRASRVSPGPLRKTIENLSGPGGPGEADNGIPSLRRRQKEIFSRFRKTGTPLRASRVSLGPLRKNVLNLSGPSGPGEADKGIPMLRRRLNKIYFAFFAKRECRCRPHAFPWGPSEKYAGSEWPQRSRRGRQGHSHFAKEAK